MASNTTQPVMVYRLGTTAAERLAARELARYLSAIAGRPVKAKAAKAYHANTKGIWVGPRDAFDDASLPTGFRKADAASDSVFVEAAAGHAIVTGVNPRSVLFAAYRYLEELGCRWLRPGKDGERVPSDRAALSRKVSVSETPSARHRCICIEGSTSVKHATDLIDYSAKRGFNAYFIQFRNAYTFFERWYGQEQFKGKKRVRISAAEADACRDKVKQAALDRGMMLHMVGHGWTCEPFGIAGEEWAPTKQKVPAKVKPLLAKVNGKRDLCGGIPLNTNLCYSNAKVRSTMATAIADYADEHRDEEVVHVWLADGVNNNCECAACAKKRPSDWYVMLLNEIDEGLTDRSLDTRIVFLAYVDLLWAPQHHRIENADRFILMFAPITRSYHSAFMDPIKAPPEKAGPYRRNKLTFPADPRTNLAMLDDWRAMFAGECVDFDYHLWWNQHPRPAQMNLAKVLFKDVRDLSKLGMDGFISCQLQRVAFPTGLYLHLMGKGLWNKRESFGPMVESYFRDVFGNAGDKVRKYLDGLAAAMDARLTGQEELDNATRDRLLKKLKRVPAIVDAFMPTIEKGQQSNDKVTAAQFDILAHHAWYVSEFATLYVILARKDSAAVAQYDVIERGLHRRLSKIHHVFDTWIAKGRLQNALAVAGVKEKFEAPPEVEA